MKRVFLLIFIIFALNACSFYNISSDEVGENFYRPKASPQEVVYMEELTDKPHEIIGVVTVNAERRQDINDVLEKMKREAAILGGDALTDIETDASGAWKKLPAQALIRDAYVRANFTGKVVVFKTPESESRLIK